MLAQIPPMGWNSWNTFTGDIDEKMIMRPPTQWWITDSLMQGTNIL